MLKLSRITCAVAALLAVSLVLGACQSAASPSAAKPVEKSPVVEQAKAPEKPRVAEQVKAPEPLKQSEAAKTSAPSKPAPKEPYRLGVITSLTGINAAAGQETRDALTLELEKINAAGGIDGHAIEVVLEDDALDPTRSATAMTKLIRQDNVLAVMGPLASHLAAATKPVAERSQLPQVTHASASPDARAQKYKWSFDVSPSEFVLADAVLDILKEKKYNKIVGISQNSPFFVASLHLIKSEGGKQGIQVTAMSDTFEMTSTDYTPQVSKLKEIVATEKPQALYLASMWVPMVPFMKSMKQLGIDLPVIGNYHFAWPQVFQQATAGELDQVVFPSFKMVAGELLPDSDPQKAIIMDFKKRFQAKYRREASYGGGYGVDALNILVNAIKVAGPDRAKIRDAVEKTANFPGLTGVFNYAPQDHEGLTKQSIAVYGIRDKKFVLLRTMK